MYRESCPSRRRIPVLGHDDCAVPRGPWWCAIRSSYRGSCVRKARPLPLLCCVTEGARVGQELSNCMLFNCMDSRSNVTRTRVSRRVWGGASGLAPITPIRLEIRPFRSDILINTCLSILLDASRPGIWNRQNRESERCRDSSCQTTCLASSPAAASNFTFTGHFEKIRVRPRLRLNFSGVLGSDWLFGVPLRPVSLARNCLAYATERNPACI